MSPTKKNEHHEKDETEFKRFENLTRNLINVSNIEVRKKMEEEKQQKKSVKNKRKTK